MCDNFARVYSRREALARMSSGFGLMALAGLMNQPAFAAGASGAANGTAAATSSSGARKPDFKPRAKNVIFCYMSGGVSHVDTFDPKPRLVQEAGKPMPMPVQRTQFNNNGTLLPSLWEYKKRGQSGLEISEMVPHLAERADDLCVIRSMTSKFNEHAQGNLFMHTGFPFIGYPSAGAWTSYGLGSESENLPGYVVLRSGDAGVPHGGVGNFGSGFLPASHQASMLVTDRKEPLDNIRPNELSALQRRKLDFIQKMDKRFVDAQGADPHVEAAIQNYELAWRMQSAVPELCDISGESEATRKLYGMDDPEPKTAAYGRQCLTARRLVERGVRFVELSCLSYNLGGGNAANPWDHHGEVQKGHGMMGHQIDQPLAGLLTDLKGRGLLDSTLVIWAGEFGRTPFSQGGNGRDHNPYGFSVWMAGGGVKSGTAYGATDEFGYHAIDKVATVYDLWATVLHILGLNHEKLTYLYSGRNVRLTDVHGHVMNDILA
jgi:hypothetical protein